MVQTSEFLLNILMELIDNNEEVPDWDAVNKIVDYIKMNIGVKDN